MGIVHTFLLYDKKYICYNLMEFKGIWIRGCSKPLKPGAKARRNPIRFMLLCRYVFIPRQSRVGELSAIQQGIPKG